MGIRKLLHDSGGFFLPDSIQNILSTTVAGSHKTYYIEGWTIMHFISGVIICIILVEKYKIRKPVELFVKLFIIHTLWEIWQTYIGVTSPNNISGYNSFTDSTFDTISFLLGSLMVYLTLQSK